MHDAGPLHFDVLMAYKQPRLLRHVGLGSAGPIDKNYLHIVNN